MSIIQTREASYKDSNPDEIEIGNSRLSKSPHSSTFSTPFHNALDIELEMWTGCVKEISKIVQNQMKISKDIFSDTFERRKDTQNFIISSFFYSWQQFYFALKSKQWEKRFNESGVLKFLPEWRFLNKF